MCLIFSGVPDFFRHGLDVPEKIRHCLKKSGRATYNRKKCVQGQLTRYQNTIEAILLRNGRGVKHSSLLMYEFLQEQVTKDIHSSRLAPDELQIRSRLAPDELQISSRLAPD